MVAPEVPLLIDYARIFYKRRWTAVTTMVVVVAVVGIHVLTSTPVYEARARLLIDTENPNIVSFKEVIDQDQTKQDYYQTLYSVLQSRSLARRTLDALHLWNAPPFDRRRQPASRLAGWVSTGIAEISKRPAAPVPSSEDETANETSAIDAFLSRLTVTPIRNSRLVDVAYAMSDAGLAATIVNTLAKNFIDQNLEHKFVASKEASSWLEERLSEQRARVEDAEATLQRYREQHDAVSLREPENIVIQKLTSLNEALTQAKMNRLQKEASYQQAQSLLANAAGLDTFPAILSNSFIQQQKAEVAALQSQFAQLGEKLGPQHPDMIKVRTALQISQAKLDAELNKVVEGLKNEYLAARTNEDNLAEALRAQKAAAQAMNRNAIDYSVLERDVQSGRQVYDSLLQRAKETVVGSELKAGNIRVVDEAERPLRPVSPQPLVDLSLGVAGGTLLACFFVLLFEYLDNRITSPAEIQTHLGLAHLGMLPALPPSGDHHWPLVNNGVPPNFSEAFRSVRTNILFSLTEKNPAIVVTSTGPSEGKSLVSSNLAIAIAQAGQRVLLIDADLRRAKMHQIFDIDQEPGLSNVLVGEKKPSECVRPSSSPGLWLLAAGRTPPNPAELIGSHVFEDFLTSLKNQFDWTIIDSPPVMAVTDASLIGHVASGVVFVVGSEMTSRHTARRALDQLAHAQVKFIGAVLNRVDLDGNARYYADYYRPEYAEYYSKPAV